MFASHPAVSIFHITLLRHGQSVGNAEGLYQGQSDFPLNETGRRQAQALANRWLSERVIFERIISSPLLRARETADIIGEALGAPLEPEADWMERNNGMLAGLKAELAAERFPRPPFIHPYLPIGETGESQWELHLRAGRAIQALVHRPPGRYLVVSHGGILNMAMYAILGIAPQANFHGPRFRFRNAAFARVTYNPAQHIWSLESMNDRLHWKPEEV